MSRLAAVVPRAIAILARPARSDAVRRFGRHRLAVVGAFVIAGLCLVAILAPVLAPYSDTEMDFSAQLQGPSWRHLFGTDNLGRDIFSRVLYGSRISLSIGILAELVALCIGVPAGLASGFFGGWVDMIVMRIIDVLLAFPNLLFIMILMAILQPNMVTIFIAIGITQWLGLARLVRGTVLSLREKEFFQAARAAGAGTGRLLFRHLLPNSLAPVTVSMSLGIPGAIMSEAALSFLGVGLRPPTPSWGAMLNAAFPYFFSAPYLIVFPAVAIGVTLLAFSFVADGLRDALDPHARLE